MPIWTGTTARGALPRPLGNEAVTRAAFLEFFDDLDTKGAFLGVANQFTQNQQAPALVAAGLTGATQASRYVGATAAGPPTSGTFAIGDFVIDRAGRVWVCTTAGSPGTWTPVSAGIKCHVFNNGNISIPNNTTTALSFDTERQDLDPNGEMHSTTVNPTRITIRTPGFYHFWGSVVWDAAANGQRNIQIVHGGTIPIAVEGRLSNGAAYPTPMTVSSLFECAANDYVELHVHQDTGAALNILLASAYSPEFAAVRVG